MRRSWTRSFTFEVSGSLGTQVATAVLLFVQTILIARVLGPEGNGVVVIAILVPQLLAHLLSGGLSESAVYFGAGRIDLPVVTRATTTLVLLTVALAAVLVGGLLASGTLKPMLGDVPMTAPALALVGFPLLLSGSHATGLLRGLDRIRRANLARMTQAVVTFLLVVAALTVPPHPTAVPVVAAWVAGWTISLGLQAGWLRAEGASFLPSWDRPTMRRLFSYGLRGHVGNVMQFANYRLDLFLVNAILDTGAAGIYAVAVRFVEILWFLPNAIGFVIMPKAARAPEGSLDRFTPRVFRVTLAVLGGGGILMALSVAPLVQTLFGSEFSDASRAALVLLPGAILLGATKVLTHEMTGRGYPERNSVIAAVGLVATVVLDLLLIPRHGIVGAAAASTAAYATVGILAILVHRQLRVQAAARGILG